VSEVARGSGTRRSGPSGSGSGGKGRRTKRGAVERKGDLRVSWRRGGETWSGGRSLEGHVGSLSGEVAGRKAAGDRQAAWMGAHEADLGPWTGGRRGCWTRRTTVDVDGRPFGASGKRRQSGSWSSESCPEAPGCLPLGECSGRRTAEAARPFDKPVKPGPSGRGGAADGRLDEALARVTGGALRGAARRACRGGERRNGPTRVSARGGAVDRDEAGVRGCMETDGEQWRRGGSAAEAPGGSTSRG
jgi:hypothetical protein